MGFVRFAAFIAILLGAIAGITAVAGNNQQPVLAEIVSGRGRIAEVGRPGNVRVTLANGHREMWTRKGNCELPRVSKSGLVGWTHGTSFHSKGALMNNILIVARERKVLTRIRTFYSFIDVWDFADADSCVIALSAGPHGPGRIEKFRIEDGELLDGCYEAHVDEQPDWAKRFLQKESEEGAYVE